MSCTDADNESGPLVKYLLPAVFGGLTLLAAKRWASQVPHSSASGVSRRRRIVKDPLIRRPAAVQPPHRHSPNSMTHGTPTATAAHKKTTDSSATPLRKNCGNFFTSEEDTLVNMAPGNRRVQQRNTRVSPMAANSGPSTSSNETTKCATNLTWNTPGMGHHIPFPNIPQDGNLLFEAMMFVFTSLAAGSQFLNLYRTVWWLPHSYTNQSMNFYLIDPYLVIFILVVLGRRLLFCLLCCAAELFTPTKFLPMVKEVIKFTVLAAVLGALGWCTFNLVQTHPILSIFYLCYPISIYLLLFGTTVTPLIHLPAGPPSIVHCCAATAPQIRQEVEVLKQDFNNRLKQIIFSSVLGAYYSSYVPWCFAQSFLYIDVYRVIRHLALVWMGLFIQHAAHCLSARYCDHLHKAALHLGSWAEDGPIPAGGGTITITTVGGMAGNSSNNHSKGNNNSNASGTGGSNIVLQWCQRMVWTSGTQVKHGRTLYTAMGLVTAAEPGNEMHCRFHVLFHDPSTLLCCILCGQVSLVLIQLFLLFNTTEWHHVLSLALLLFSNYYTLFKIVRDYLVTWKVYQAEFTIQEKANYIT